MSRKKASNFDSLDLLLDTICNLFGGVLFIAMLVIILLNMTSEQAAMEIPDATSQQKLTSAQIELADSQAELDSLRRAVREQENLAKKFADPRVRDLITQSTQKQSSVASVTATHETNLLEAGKKQDDVNRIATALQAMETALDKIKKQLAVVDQQLKQEQQLRTRTVKLPRQRQTSKQQIAYLLKGGRLFAYIRRDSGGNVTRETADSQETTSAGVTYLEPVPGGGTPVNPAGDTSGSLAAKLAGWDPNQHFIAICVWPDSFEHFSVVRQILVEGGYEYQLQPFPADGKVSLGAAATSNLVQ
jgi:DNA-binding transcriptional MerR regulator